MTDPSRATRVVSSDGLWMVTPYHYDASWWIVYRRGADRTWHVFKVIANTGQDAAEVLSSWESDHATKALLGDDRYAEARRRRDMDPDTQKGPAS